MIFSKESKSNPEEVSAKAWREAEALSAAILAFAEEERSWYELKDLLGTRNPAVVARAFHMAMYEYLCAIARNRKKR